MTRDYILSTLSDKKEILKRDFGVDRIGLFGSYAKGCESEDSDIDIYVELKENSFDRLARLALFLEKLYNKKVDLMHRHKRSGGAIFDSIYKEVIFG